MAANTDGGEHGLTRLARLCIVNDAVRPTWGGRRRELHLQD